MKSLSTLPPDPCPVHRAPLLHCTRYGLTSKRQLDRLDALAAFYLLLFILFILFITAMLTTAHFDPSNN